MGRLLGVVAIVLATASALAVNALAELSQKGDLLVSYSGKVRPSSLPRHGAAGVAVSIGGKISTTDGTPPPQLKTIEIEINRHGRLDYEGLPVCRLGQIQPSSARNARNACGGALIGEGSFSADVVLPQQSPFPSKGQVLAFNGRIDGHPAILAHVYGTEPLPTSYTLPFAIKHAAGTYGTVLTAYLPKTTGDWGFVTGISMTLGRRFRYRGQSHSYLSAGCPAPKGFRGVFFPLLRASFAFAEGHTLDSTLMRSCKVAG
ncbi:MAG TPA: hypothetical protein VFP23_10570 [Solirubrobacterales bacterium]|nr:hypothetical protein [Solirubrobacterales bacterium]